MSQIRFEWIIAVFVSASRQSILDIIRNILTSILCTLPYICRQISLTQLLIIFTLESCPRHSYSYKHVFTNYTISIRRIVFLAPRKGGLRTQPRIRVQMRTRLIAYYYRITWILENRFTGLKWCPTDLNYRFWMNLKCDLTKLPTRVIDSSIKLRINGLRLNRKKSSSGPCVLLTKMLV